MIQSIYLMVATEVSYLNEEIICPFFSQISVNKGFIKQFNELCEQLVLTSRLVS